jgi:hypothetical protein
LSIKGTQQLPSKKRTEIENPAAAHQLNGLSQNLPDLRTRSTESPEERCSNALESEQDPEI